MNKQIFQLGGSKFEAPLIIGAAVKSRWSGRLMRDIVMWSDEDENFIKLLTGIVEPAQPNNIQIPDPDLERQYKNKQKNKFIEKNFEDIGRAYLVAKNYEYTLAQLETILTPLDGVSVKEAFENASAEEVKIITNFFDGLTNTTKEKEIISPKNSTTKKQKVELHD